MAKSVSTDLCPEMLKSIHALEVRNVAYTRPTRYQLKVGRLNFWPGRGTIVEDEIGRLESTGLDAFLSLVERRRTTWP